MQGNPLASFFEMTDRSIVFGVDFKIALGMMAGGAEFGCDLSDDDVSAVAAFPYLDLALFKNSGGLYVAKQGAVALLVMLFNGGHQAEFPSQFGKAFLFGCYGISAIRISQNNAAKGTFLYGEVWEDASNKIAYNTRKRYYLGAELDGVMNYPLKSGIIDYIRNKNTRQLEYAINEVMFNMPKRIRDFTMNLLGSHDTERILTALGGENSQGKTNEELRDIRMDKKAYDIARRRLLSAYTVIATLPGIPSVFYGDEVGMEGYSDPFNRRSFPWDNIDNNILSHYKKIGKIRRKNSVYKNGDFELLYLSDDLFAFKRTDGEDEYITVYNNADFDITVEGSDLFKNAFTGRYIKSCVLGPEMACVFVKNKDVQVTIK